MKTLVAIAKALGPEALAALVELARQAVSGSSAETLARSAEKLAHCVGFEKAMRAARGAK